MSNKLKNIIIGFSIAIGLLLLFTLAVGITMSLYSDDNSNIETSSNKDSENVVEEEAGDKDKEVNNYNDTDYSLEERKESNKVITQELLKNFDKKYDEMEQITWYYPKGEESFLVKNDTESFQFRPYVGIDDSGNEWCRLVTGFSKDGWVFFDKITIKADDTISNINVSHGERKGEVNRGYGISEWVDLEIDRDNYLRTYSIVDSNDAKIRFSGDTSYTEYTINEQQKKQLKEVLNIFMSIEGSNMD